MERSGKGETKRTQAGTQVLGDSVAAFFLSMPSLLSAGEGTHALPTLRRGPDSNQASRFADPLLASLGLPCAASGSALRNTAAESRIPAPQGVIQAIAGAIPQPVAAIASTGARNQRRQDVFPQLLFVFPSLFTRFSSLEIAFPHRKKLKTSMKRSATGGKPEQHTGKTATHTENRLFPGWKSPSHIGKSREPLWKNGFHTGQPGFPPGFRRFHVWAHVFHTEKTPKPLCFFGPQTGHDTAKVCPSKHPDGYREVVK